MTTWTNTAITRTTPNTHGALAEVTYEIAGISGDTGGTLTATGFKYITNVVVTANVAAGMAAALQRRISGNTVVLTYTNPTAAHTIRITVFGEKGL